MTANTGAEQAGGRFRPGKSGNPAGKPKGARHRATVMAEQLMRDDEKGVVDAVLTAAKAGDMTAARLVLERIAPVRKGRPLTIALPATDTAADVAKAMSHVVAEMAAGEITPDEATTVTAVLEARRKAIELTDFEERLRRIEARTRQ